MATSSNQMEELCRRLECSICLERFTKPKVLPCLHTFCEKCIQQQVDNKAEGGLVPCPMCTIKATVPEDGAAGLKDNVFIAQISDVILDKSENLCDLCQLRGSDVLAVKMCIECRDHLCEGCADMHKYGSRQTFDHHVVSLSDVRSGQCFDEMRSCQKVYCPIHQDETLKIFCEGCRIPICLLCKALKHDQHVTASLTDAVKKADEEMQTLIKQCQDIATFEELSEKSKVALENINFDHSNLKGELTRAFKQFRDDIKHVIDKKEQAALDELNANVLCAKKKAELAFNEAERNRLKVTDTLNYAETMLKIGKDAEKLQQYGVMNRLKTCQGVMTEMAELILPAKLTIPDLTITQLVKCHITSHLPNLLWSRAPTVLDRGKLVNSFSTQLEGEKQPDCWGMTVNHDSRVIITDNANNKVKVFSREGQFDRPVDQGEHQLQFPCGATCNDVGDIFVTDGGIGGVVLYNEEGVMKKVMKDVYECGYNAGITCKNNQVILADYVSKRVVITDLNLVVKKVINKKSLGLSEFKPYYVVVDSNDHLVVSDVSCHCVYIIDCNESAILHKYQPTGELGLRCPCGVCVDICGNILVADSRGVHVISSAGDHVGVPITSQDVRDPYALAISGPGKVAVLELRGDLKMFKYMDV